MVFRQNYYSSPSTFDYAYPPPPAHAPSQRPLALPKRYPPRPSVEDVRQSKEDEVAFRGSLDQDPIMIEVEPMEPVRERASTMSSSEWSVNLDVPTPPTSDDEKRDRGRRKIPKLETVRIPEMMRGSSPYAYSKSEMSTPNLASGPAFFSTTSFPPPTTSSLSSAFTQPPTSVPTSASQFSGDRQFPMHKQPPRRQDTATSFSSDVLEDDDSVPVSSFTTTPDRTPARYSSQDPSTVSRSNPPSNGGTPLSFPRRPVLSEEARRYTDSSMELPRAETYSRTRKPAPLKVATLVHEASSAASSASLQLRTPSGRVSSRETPTSSPSPSAHCPLSPPRSPRASVDRGRGESFQSAAISSPASKETSKDASPHQSPRPSFTLPATDRDWNSAFASNAARSTRASSRLASTTLPEDLARASRSDSIPPRLVATLPYPADLRANHSMPEISDYQHPAPQSAYLEPAPLIAKTLSRAATPTTSSLPKQRPILAKHHTMKETVPLPSADISKAPRQVSMTSTPRLQPYVTPPPPPTLPPCPRKPYTSGYEDWYTLVDCPGLDICADCLDSIVAPSIFRSFFRRAPRRPSSEKVRCDMSDAWMRLAWLLIRQRQLPSLDLLRALSNQILLDDERCPEKEEAPRTWYTVRDGSSSKVLREFTVCLSDVHKIELLLPGLRGLFVPLPLRSSGYNSSTPSNPIRLCAFRATSANTRFVQYLDLLTSLHEPAYALQRPIDFSPFTSLARHLSTIPSCPRDTLLLDAKWHTIPSLPIFTVCPSCYESTILPYQQTSSDLALRFNRNPKAVSTENPILGSSCQLYSARMRRVFARAVEGNDMRYLARKAEERKEREEYLQVQERKVSARRDWVDGRLREIGRGSRDRRDGRREVSAERELRDERRRLGVVHERLVEEWRDWE
ncbi:hypothetical protein MBLNU457_g0533t1 [Dothideomycetes sp. NU457]